MTDNQKIKLYNPFTKKEQVVLIETPALMRDGYTTEAGTTHRLASSANV